MAKLENKQTNSNRGAVNRVAVKKRSTATSARTKPKPNTLDMTVDEADLKKSQAENVAKNVITIAAVNAAAGIAPWSKQLVGTEAHIVTLLDKIEAQTAALHAGDMSEVEAMLFGQALTLQAMFTTFTYKAAHTLSTNTPAMEMCLRMAFKAQSQCRATLETLAEVKNPRTATFIKQANVAGGHQQINNGAAGGATQPSAHEKTADQPNELLSDERANHVKPVVTGTTRKASKRNSCVEAMGTGHRAAHTVG